MDRGTKCKIHYINDIGGAHSKFRLLPKNKAINFSLYPTLRIPLLP
jgi:hypothetical protein